MAAAPDASGESAASGDSIYAALAANEAEKRAELNILEVTAFGSFGRVYLGGSERDIMAGYQAAIEAIEGVSGRSQETRKSE